MFTTYKRIGSYVYSNTPIGVGQFSEVFMGTSSITNEKVAVKIIDTTQMNDPILFTLMNNEVKILKLLSTCPNILQLKDVYQDRQCVFLVTEYCNQGDLTKLMMQNNMTETQIMEIFKDIVNALIDLKRTSVIHRDIKPDNILINNSVAKLADFGFALSTNVPCSEEILDYSVGTPVYMAPESIIDNAYGLKADVWSLGVVLYQMLFNGLPFPCSNENQLKQRLAVYKRNNTLVYTKSISPYIEALLKGMLTYDKNYRWSIDQCKDHLQRWQSTIPTRLVSPENNRFMSKITIDPSKPQLNDHRKSMPNNIEVRQSMPNMIDHRQSIPNRVLTPLDTQYFTERQHYAKQSYNNNGRSPNSAVQSPTNSINGNTKTIEIILSNEHYIQSTTQYGLFLNKINKLLAIASPFECKVGTIHHTQMDVMALHLKLQYCVLSSMSLVFTSQQQYKQLANETADGLINIKKVIYRQSQCNFMRDIHFLNILNSHYTLEELIDPLITYLSEYISLINNLFRTTDSSDKVMIILLDYLVILHILITLLQSTGRNWVHFNEVSGIEQLCRMTINMNANRHHWEIINKKIIQLQL